MAQNPKMSPFGQAVLYVLAVLLLIEGCKEVDKASFWDDLSSKVQENPEN